jgi:tryptophan synthase alpha chain
MISISEKFALLRANQQCALIPFITAGDPDLATTAIALRTLDANGADFIELGVPYSDPLADGPVIQAAATRALNQGIRLAQVLEMVRHITPELNAPIILFTYYNPILNLGVEEFLQQIADAGVKGLVVPDLPLEESSQLIDCAAALDIEVILLVAPTSSNERICAIAQQSRGFIYLVSVTGVTGVRTELPSRVREVMQAIRSVSDKPIAVGFGIAQADQARQLVDWGTDAVIVGSAFVQRLANEGINPVADFCRELKTAIH